MKRFVHPLLMLLARVTEKESTQMIEFLKAENRMLRNKLPKRIEVTLAERARHLELGTRLGSKIKEVITIVHQSILLTHLKLNLPTPLLTDGA
jgi:putative transposase